MYNNTVNVTQWPLMDGLLHLVQRGGAWAGCGPVYQLHIIIINNNIIAFEGAFCGDDDFVVDLLYGLLYNKSTTSRSNGVWVLLFLCVSTVEQLKPALIQRKCIRDPMAGLTKRLNNTLLDIVSTCGANSTLHEPTRRVQNVRSFQQQRDAE